MAASAIALKPLRPALPLLWLTGPDDRTSQSPAEHAHAPEAILRGKRAVIAEDEGVTQVQLRRMLRSHGVEVVGIASNGQEALDMALRTRPDLVIMDVRMPILDGLEASRRLLANFSTCVVILTAFTDEEHRTAAHEIGVSGYVVKPVTAQTLLPKLAEALREFLAQ